MVKKLQSKRQRAGLVSVVAAGHLPAYSPQPIEKRTVRYLSTTAQTAFSVNVQNLIASCGTVCYIANSAGVAEYGAVRLVKVRAWVSPATAGTPVSVIINFATNSAINTMYEITDTSFNVSSPAYVMASPPSNSESGYWHEWSSTDSLFTITSGANCILELDLEIVKSDNEINTSINYASGVATLGRIYYTALSAAANSFVPIGLTTNF